MPPSLRSSARRRARDRQVHTARVVSDVTVPMGGDAASTRVRVLRYDGRSHSCHVLAFADNGSTKALYLVLPPGLRLMVELCLGTDDVRFARTDVQGIALFRDVPPGPMRLMYTLVRGGADLSVRTAIATEWTVLP